MRRVHCGDKGGFSLAGGLDVIAGDRSFRRSRRIRVVAVERHDQERLVFYVVVGSRCPMDVDQRLSRHQSLARRLKASLADWARCINQR